VFLMSVRVFKWLPLSLLCAGFITAHCAVKPIMLINHNYHYTFLYPSNCALAAQILPNYSAFFISWQLNNSVANPLNAIQILSNVPLWGLKKWALEIAVTKCKGYFVSNGNWWLWSVGRQWSEARDSSIQQSKERGRKWTKRKGTKQCGHEEQKEKKNNGILHYTDIISQFDITRTLSHNSTLHGHYLTIRHYTNIISQLDITLTISHI
jgi:hypothetical protein